MKEEKWSDMLRALGHPIRLRILEGLIKDECNVAGIQRSLRVPQSTISQHLRILRDRGILRVRQEGRKRCYRVADRRVHKILKVLAEK